MAAANIRPGTIRPLARSGLGWMLLSARSDETVEKLVRRINFEEEDRKKKVDLKELMQKLRKIRKDGYVISLHTVTAGAGVIGMLLPERRHGRILAIGVHPYVTGQSHRIKYFEELYAYINSHDGVVHMVGDEIVDHFG